jgi:hypothetical protein
MKILAIVALAFAAAFFAIGVNESLYYGVGRSYWIFMFSLGFLFGYALLKRNENPPEKPAKKVTSGAKATKQNTKPTKQKSKKK